MVHFHKMHGLGNDFVIIDARHDVFEATPDIIHMLADRKRGIGCDQFIILRADDVADAFMQIFNADGNEVNACGNATRCAAWLLAQPNENHIRLRTNAGILDCKVDGMHVTVNMGQPMLDWQAIPMQSSVDTLYIPLDGLPDGVAVNVGNPHLVVFMDNVADIDITSHGSVLEQSILFPEGANITFAQIHKEYIVIVTWERGVGQTLACGTAACATQIAARRRGLVGATSTIHMQGGTATITWEGCEENVSHPVIMRGETAYVFSGDIAL